MTALTFPIPLSTLGVGPHTFGPVTLASVVSRIVLDLDRNAGAASLNATAAASLTVRADYSIDSGATWTMAFSATTTGGNAPDPDTGVAPTNTTVTQSRPLAAGTQVRGIVTVSGAPVSVQGSLTVT